ncbi:hypothetical protein LKO27_10100 [Tessaracoccus sp. OS52]|uniref:hypothetical protein n=1 Tax=Tessaracoccus sp. OS52 TaxID=2886691 RepID=UPI001D101AA4|nr:hypothetical protein [Tessaracoccus sp. OS52]MCC2593756.1 hypothetical protein [Tessaracoccus sp. OS52]
MPSDSWKYAVIERERRFLVRSLPDGVVAVRQITDRYLTGTRLRLREIQDEAGNVTRKLGQKVRLGDGPQEIACTSVYLDESEWAVLSGLPAATLSKVRHIVERDGWRMAVDVLPDGTLLAEIDDGDTPPRQLPPWLDVIAEVTADEDWTGATLAAAAGALTRLARSPS